MTHARQVESPWYPFSLSLSPSIAVCPPLSLSLSLSLIHLDYSHLFIYYSPGWGTHLAFLNQSIDMHQVLDVSCQGRILDFVWGGDEIRRGVWGTLKIPGRGSRGGNPPPPPPEADGFSVYEYWSFLLKTWWILFKLWFEFFSNVK